MAETGVRDGEMVQGDTPEWQPLLNLAGEEITGEFMWMYGVRLTDGGALHAYKHFDTRRYVHLDLRGAAAEALASALRGRAARYTPQ